MRPILSLLASSVGGGVVALAGVYALHWRLAQAEQNRAPIRSPAREVAPARAQPALAFEGERAWAPVQVMPAILPTASVASNPATEAPPVHDDPKQEAEDIGHEERAFQTAFASEAVDQTWAPVAQSKLGAQLIAVGEKKGFRLDRVDCKTTKCVASLSFSDRSKARESLGGILHENYEPNCAVSIRLPDGPRDRPISAPVSFDCEDSRVSDASIER